MSTRMAAVRGLTGLLTAVLFAVAAFGLPGQRAVAAAVPMTVGRTVTAIPHAQGLPLTAAEPPGADDPDRVHVDPGVWPLLVLIVAFFVFGLVLRGSRARRERRDPD